MKLLVLAFAFLLNSAFAQTSGTHGDSREHFIGSCGKHVPSNMTFIKYNHFGVRMTAADTVEIGFLVQFLDCLREQDQFRTRPAVLENNVFGPKPDYVRLYQWASNRMLHPVQSGELLPAPNNFETMSYTELSTLWMQYCPLGWRSVEFCQEIADSGSYELRYWLRNDIFRVEDGNAPTIAKVAVSLSKIMTDSARAQLQRGENARIETVVAVSDVTFDVYITITPQYTVSVSLK